MDMQAFRQNIMAVLGLGALWVWFFGAGNPGSTIFGWATQDTFSYRIGYQILCAGVLFGLSFCRTPFGRVRSSVQVVAGALGCGASACLYRLGAALSAPWLTAMSCAVTALSYAILLRVWMSCFRASFDRLFPLVLLASVITMVAWLATSVFSSSLGFVLALVAAGAVGILLYRAVPNAPAAAVAKPSTPRGVFLQCAGVTVAYLAGSLLHMEAIGGLEEWAYLSLVGSVGLAVWALWRRALPRPEIFIGLSLFICVCVGCAVLGALPPVFIGTLASAAFWLMFLFAIAWLGAWDYECAQVPCSVFLRGASMLLLGAAVAKLAVFLGLPSSSSLVLCALLTAVGLALFFVGSSRCGDRSSGEVVRERVSHAVPMAAGAAQVPVAASLEERCSALARTGNLTDREERMLVLLAQGNSLKKIAELLYMSEGTAKYHRHNIYVKLQVSTRQELIDLVGGSTDVQPSEPLGQKG